MVNATRNTPPRFKELHSALEGVGETAATHVNLSRLHLAQRGLESERPVIRVAGMFIFRQLEEGKMANWKRVL